MSKTSPVVSVLRGCPGSVFGSLLLLFLALLSCAPEPGEKSLSERWLEGVEAMGEPNPIVEVVLYFDNLWHSVAYEVLAERTLTLDDAENTHSLTGMVEWFDSVESVARERFYVRYGLYPADYFPPLKPHEVMDLIPDLGEVEWAIHALEWEKILQRHGLTRAEEIPPYMARWRAVAQVDLPEVADHRATPTPGTYVEFFYGRKSGGPENHRQLVAELREDPWISRHEGALGVLCIAGLDRTEAESFRVDAERRNGSVELASCEGSGAILVGPMDHEGARSMQRSLPISGRYLHLYAEVREVTAFRLPEPASE